MPRFQSLAFSAMLKGVRRIKQANSIKPELKTSPNEFQLTEPLPVGNVWDRINDDGLRFAAKVMKVRGVNARWGRETLITKLKAVGVTVQNGDIYFPKT